MTLVRNITSKCTNNDIQDFVILKFFDVTAHPSLFWVKVNIDGALAGTPPLADCGAISRNHNCDHLGSFACNLSQENTLLDELMGAILAMEHALNQNWDRCGWRRTSSSWCFLSVMHRSCLGNLEIDGTCVFKI